MDFSIPQTLDQWNEAGADYLPGLLGIAFSRVDKNEVIASFEARKALGAWNGYLHAGSIVSLADTCCGYGTIVNLPQGARGFTTIELKSNFLSTVHEGPVECSAHPVHVGRSTQVWDAAVSASGRILAHFRCTQMVLWPR